MRIVNLLTTDIRPTSICYNKVEQPMYVYHSFEELMIAEHLKIQNGNFILINTADDYRRVVELLKIDLVYNPNIKFINVLDNNIWIRTVDEFIPDKATHDGTISYKLDDNNNKIPTDGVFIRLFFILPTPTRHVFFTSSGVHTVGMTKWDMTGAIREWFTQESDKRSTSTSYAKYISKLVCRRRPDVRYVKLAFSMFHPMSPNFMDFDRCVKVVFGQRVKAIDRQKLLQSKAFREAMVSAIKILFPALSEAIRNEIPPEEMAKKLAEIYGIAKDSKDVDKMLKVFQKIEDVGYTNQQDPLMDLLTGGNSGTLVDPLAPKKLTEAEEKILAETKEKDDMPESYIMNNSDELLNENSFELNEEAAKQDKKDEETK